MTRRLYNVLFLCTHNSARSIMAETILNHIGEGKFVAHSAGSHPRGQVNPYVIELLEKTGFDTSKLYSKSWDQFAEADAPDLDFVFTLCDDAAGEVCPVWPGQPMTAHWPFPDPSSFEGSEAEKRAFVANVYRQINTRLGIFANLPIASLDRMSLQRRIEMLSRDQDTEMPG
jgi:protein-tyrosine-phosphatase